MRHKPLAAAAPPPLLLVVLAALLLASARAAGVGADGNATLACANRTLAPAGSAANCSAPAPAPEAVARTYVDVYGDYFIAFGVLFVASLVWCAWYARHRRAAWWSLRPRHVIYLGVGDTFSDFTFIAQMSTKQLDWSAVRTSAFVLTCLAALLNVVVMVWYLRRIVLNNEPKHRPFIRWLQVHRHVVVALLLFSLSSARFLTLMYSSLFELAMFSAPLPVSAMEAIDLISLITVLVEDLPQLAFVVYVSEVGDQGWDNFAITAVAFSLIIIAVTTSSRWCTLVFYLNKEHRANDAVYADHAKGACANERASERSRDPGPLAGDSSPSPIAPFIHSPPHPPSPCARVCARRLQGLRAGQHARHALHVRHASAGGAGAPRPGLSRRRLSRRCDGRPVTDTGLAGAGCSRRLAPRACRRGHQRVRGRAVRHEDAAARRGAAVDPGEQPQPARGRRGICGGVCCGDCSGVRCRAWLAVAPLAVPGPARALSERSALARGGLGAGGPRRPSVAAA